MAYERLTVKRHSKNYIKTPLDGIHDCPFISNKVGEYEYTTGEAIDRLAELEDKIENGTLIEIDKNLIGENIIGIHQFTDGTYELNLDENIVVGYSIDGVVTWNCTQQFNDEFRTGMYFKDTEKGRVEAEEKLKGLQKVRQ